MTTIGNLFTGYGGLNMGVTMALDPSAQIAWTSDIEPGPCKLATTPQATDATATTTGYGANPHEVARELPPTPSASDSIMGPPQTSGHQSAKATKLATHIEYTDFGKYAPTIARWEQILGRMAPAPTIPSRREGGRARLSTRFVEWMMGLPDGYITNLNLPRAHQLLLLGNGVVPQQAALAVRTLIHTAKEAENARF